MSKYLFLFMVVQAISGQSMMSMDDPQMFGDDFQIRRELPFLKAGIARAQLEIDRLTQEKLRLEDKLSLPLPSTVQDIKDKKKSLSFLAYSNKRRCRKLMQINERIDQLQEKLKSFRFAQRRFEQRRLDIIHARFHALPPHEQRYMDKSK